MIFLTLKSYGVGANGPPRMKKLELELEIFNLKVTTHKLQYPNVFFVQSMSTLKISMFAKKLELRILNFGPMADIFMMTKIFKFFFKNSIFWSFSKFFWLSFLFCLVRHSSQCIHQISRSNINLEPLNWMKYESTPPPPNYFKNGLKMQIFA